MKNNLGTFFGLPRWGVGAVVLAASVFVSSRAYGGVVAEWEFNSYSGGTPSGMPADFGSGTLNGNISGSAGVMAFTPGTAINSQDSIAGTAIVLSAAPFGTVTETLTFQVLGTGLSAFVMTYAAKDIDVTSQAQNWSYSTDGSSYTSATSVSSGSSYGLQTIDFSADTALNGAANVYFQLQVSGSTDYAVAFDNFAIAAVPEVPITGMVMGFGVLAIAVGGTLRRKSRPAVSSIA